MSVSDFPATLVVTTPLGGLGQILVGLNGTILYSLFYLDFLKSGTPKLSQVLQLKSFMSNMFVLLVPILLMLPSPLRTT